MMKDKKMLIKFENKSDRVKGLAFHPKRPWILASLHSGAVQLWDYRMQVMIDKFEEHDGPVRGVDFHRSQPLFVSGGDDYRIKVWNYQSKRCLFNLLGHLDYIRTVQFHVTYPWILSASDDQTIRIWNWQSRQCLTVLSGHNHYVMCAQFHPKEDLVLSASLDQTVRVWDVSGLRKKTVSIAGEDYNPNPSSDLFGGSDVVVKHVLEGHTRGVNWASFHPTLSLIVSGADDREVKLWRMNDSKAWEVDTMRGHINNVSCVVFHPKQELVLSNSEDKTIRIWDMSKQASPVVLRRENDRYWILAIHPTLNLLAAGHDSGMVIFKLNRERPPSDLDGDNLYLYKEQYVYEYSLKTGKEKPLMTTRRQRGANTAGAPRSLVYNSGDKSQHCFLLYYEADSSYELCTVSKAADGRGEENAPHRGYAKSVVWVSRNRFAVLDKSRQIWLKNLKNETKNNIALANIVPTSIFPGGVGRLLIRSNDAILLYDIQALKTISELPIQSRYPIKQAIWSPDGKYVALISRTNIYIANHKLEDHIPILETSRVKGGCWDACGVFVYTTSTHIKYLLPNGDSGIIRTLENCVYLLAIHNSTLYYLDRESVVGKTEVDTTEYQFKIALMKNRKKDVMSLMQSKKLVGQSIISYLHQKGHPELALHFVQDDQAKFNLALECGDVATALECAGKLDNEESWHKLGVEALRQGDHQVVEAAYQKTKNFERLSFLYLITGNSEKLGKMLQIATLRNDLMGRFHNALYLGNAAERVNVLRDAGQTGLALLTAKAHGLEEQAAALEGLLGDRKVELPPLDEAKLLFPPLPIMKDTNWPLLETHKNFLDMGEEKEDVAETVEAKPDSMDFDDEPSAAVPEWDTELPTKKDTAVTAGGWDELGMDLGPVVEEDTKQEAGDSDFVMPLSGKDATQVWQNNSTLAADLIAAGAFDQAMHMLNRTIGVVNFDPLKSHFLSIHAGAFAELPLTHTDQRCALHRENKDKLLPRPLYTITQCVDLLKQGYKHVTEGAFAPALTSFSEILQTIPLISVEKKVQVSEVKELRGICAEYIMGLRLELERRQVADPARAASLACYFTQCKLQPVHTLLALRVAIKCAYAAKCFNVTGNLCRRTLEYAVSANATNQYEKLVNFQQIRGVLKMCEKENSDACDLKFTEGAKVCCASFEPIPKLTQHVSCPFCESPYLPQFDGTVCVICNLSKVGAEVTGLRCFAE